MKPDIVGNTVAYQTIVQTNLKYASSFGHYHVFQIQNDVLKSVDYKGCSGAPIVDEQGEVVSLVCKGFSDAGVTTIWGINLSAYKAAIEIEAANDLQT